MRLGTQSPRSCIAASFAALVVLFPLPALATRSISACEPATGECGIAVVTKVHGMPFTVPFGAPGVVVDVQAVAEVAVGEAVLRGVEVGLSAAAALATALEVASQPEWLQVGVVTLDTRSPSGASVASYMGARVVSDLQAYCQVKGSTFVVNADMQTSSAVCQTMANAFAASEGRILARRLFDALQAGTPVGHDVRGEHSATVRVYSAASRPAMDIAVAADVQSTLHWSDALGWKMEAWLANWEPPGNPLELVPFTAAMMTTAEQRLHDLGYLASPAGDGWTPDAEASLLAWETVQLGGATKPTVISGAARLIEKPVAVVLLEGQAHDVLIPAPGIAAGTRSFSACDPDTAECGIAVTGSRHGLSFAVPHGAPGVAVGSQGRPDGPAAKAVVRGVSDGSSAAAALAAALQVATAPEWLHLGVVALDASAPSRVAVVSHIGAKVLSDQQAVCEVVGPTSLALAEQQPSEATCQAMTEAFVASRGKALGRRLFAALLAGAPTGDGETGEYAASLRVWSTTNQPWMNYAVAADVSGSLHWADDLRWGLEVWLANWTNPGDTRELVPFTEPMIQLAQTQLVTLGYLRSPVTERWSAEAESALLAWELVQLDGTQKPTVVSGGALFIEQPVAVLLLEGAARDTLIPAPAAAAGGGGCGCGSNGVTLGLPGMVALLAWLRRKAR